MTVFVVLAVVAVIVLVGGVVAARTRARRAAASNQIVPGIATRAPSAWARTQTPEALLHRRLQEATATVRADPRLVAAGFTDARAALAVQAVAVDDALVVAAALPGRGRDKPLAEVEKAVDAIERAVAALVAVPAENERDDLDRALAEVTARVTALTRGEGDGPPPTASA